MPLEVTLKILSIRNNEENQDSIYFHCFRKYGNNWIGELFYFDLVCGFLSCLEMKWMMRQISHPLS